MSARFAFGPLALAIAAGCTPPPAQRPVAPGSAFDAACDDLDDWDKPGPPVHIHGGTYLVGTCGISAILVTGRDGHVVIDSGTQQGADLVAANIRRLGFRLEDVKYLLHSHEHFDHVGGVARLQQLTGARLVTSAPAAQVLRTGEDAPEDPQAGMHAPFPPARVDQVVGDGDPVRVGDVMLVPMATPGHTPGALTWHWSECDGGVCRRIVYADSLSPISRDDYRFSDHPEYVAAFRAGLARLAALDCDILMTPHPSASGMLDRMAGRAPLVNREGCRDYAAGISKRLDARLAEEARP